MKKYSGIIWLIFLFFPIIAQDQKKDPDPHRFDTQIQQFIEWDEKNSFPEDAVLFIGSSSIRLWPTRISFPDQTIINRGFGGAHISDIIFFIEETVLKYQSPVIVFYCGDNDIAAGKSSEQVFKDYLKFVTQVHNKYPLTKIIYLPAKPSIARWNYWPQMEKLNELVRRRASSDRKLYYVDTATPMLTESAPPPADLFVADGLHLSRKGYELWVQLIAPKLKALLPAKEANP